MEMMKREKIARIQCKCVARLVVEAMVRFGSVRLYCIRTNLYVHRNPASILQTNPTGIFTVPPFRCSLHQFAFGYKFSLFKVTSRYLQFINNLPVCFDVSFWSDGGGGGGDGGDRSRAIPQCIHGWICLATVHLQLREYIYSECRGRGIAVVVWGWAYRHRIRCIGYHYHGLSLSCAVLMHPTKQTRAFAYLLQHIFRAPCVPSTVSVGLARWPRWARWTQFFLRCCPLSPSASSLLCTAGPGHRVLLYIIIISIYYFQQSRMKKKSLSVLGFCFMAGPGRSSNVLLHCSKTFVQTFISFWGQQTANLFGFINGNVVCAIFNWAPTGKQCVVAAATPPQPPTFYNKRKPKISVFENELNINYNSSNHRQN